MITSQPVNVLKWLIEHIYLLAVPGSIHRKNTVKRKVTVPLSHTQVDSSTHVHKSVCNKYVVKAKINDSFFKDLYGIIQRV